jgi:hypothetical protein
MKTKILVLIFFLGLIYPCITHASTQRLCKTATGVIFARKKCKKGESAYSLSEILSSATASINTTPGSVGPVGPMGPTGPVGSQGRPGPASKIPGPKGILDFSACHTIVSGPASSSGQISLAANCDSVNEFLFDHEFSITGDRAFIQKISMTNSSGSNNETLPYGVFITANLTAPGDYSLLVKAFCCPR